MVLITQYHFWQINYFIFTECYPLFHSTEKAEIRKKFHFRLYRHVFKITYNLHGAMTLCRDKYDLFIYSKPLLQTQAFRYWQNFLYFILHDVYLEKDSVPKHTRKNLASRNVYSRRHGCIPTNTERPSVKALLSYMHI